MTQSAALARFVPRLVPSLLRDEHPVAAQLTTADGIILSADISGFTALTEQLSRGGPAGIEAIQAVLNQSFPRIVAAIERYGGDVLKFAGDATIAWWPARDDGERAAAAAAAAALEMQSMMPSLQRDVGHPLGLRVAIGAGTAWTAIVGGDNGRWECVVGGEPFSELAATRDIALGEAAAGPRAWELLRRGGAGIPRNECTFILERLTAAPSIANAGAEWNTALEGFIPAHIVNTVKEARVGRLAELRTVSVLFLSLDRSLIGAPKLEDVQHPVALVQRTVAEFGGDIVQLLVDDKGVFVALAAWGVPLASHGNDAERAALAAFELNARFSALALRTSVGVASGRAFSGLRGAESRAEYALIGNVVNRAARLMSKADGRVLCDEATSRSAGAVAFEDRGSAELKGLGVVRLFAPAHRVAAVTPATGPLRGRAAELDMLVNAVRDARAGSRVAVIEGEAGIGKSHLAQALTRSLHEQGIAIGAGAADPLERDTPYFALRSAITTLLGLDPSQSADQRRAHVLRLIGDDQQRINEAPLLAALVDVSLPETDLTRAMSGRARADATEELLVHLLAASNKGDVRMLLIDDAHWMDAASWRALGIMRKRATGLCIVIVARALDTAFPDPRHVALAGDAGATRIRLGPVGPSYVPAIVADVLGVPVAPGPLAKFVLERSAGHPLVAREITAALVAAGVVHRVEADRAAVDAALLDGIALPDSLQGLATARIDRLAPELQNVLKTASVLGRDFAEDTVSALVESDAPASLASLSVHGLLTASAGGRYTFADSVARDAAYELLPPTRRRDLHARAASWYEQHHRGDAAFYGRVARHFTEAHDAARAMEALERAAEHALRTGALREAQSHLRRLIGIAREGLGDVPAPVRVDSGVLGRWLRKLGVAEYGLGDLMLAREHLETATSLLGDPIPAPRRTPAALLRETARWAARLALGRVQSSVPNARAADLVPGLFTLAGIYNVSDQPGLSLYASLRSYNVAERTGATPELMQALGPITYIVTLMGMTRLGERYMERLREVHATLDRPLEYAEGLYAGGLAAVGQGLFERGRRDIDEACAIYRRIGERRGLMSALAAQGNLNDNAGHAAASARAYKELRQIAEDTGDTLTGGWALTGLGIIALRAGRHDESIELSRRAAASTREAGETVSYIAARGTLALAHLRLGDFDAVRAIVDETIQLIEASPARSIAFHSLHGFDCIAEAVQTMWESDAVVDAARARDAHARLARVVSSRLASLARTFAIAKSVAAMRAGGESWLLGRRRRAFAQWRRAVAIAERAGFHRDEARARVEIARHMPHGRERDAHAVAAAELFERVGAPGDLAWARTRGLERPAIE